MTDGRPGAFVAVVGPSGAGKDTVMSRVREQLSSDGRFVFARRVVTRDQNGGEDHDCLDPAAFEAACADGAYVLSWRAHGLGYGIPAAYGRMVDGGAVVVANLSRAVLTDARARFPRFAVLEITAPAEVLAARLAARGRESTDEIAARLARVEAPVTGPDVHRIDNGGPLADAVAAAVSVLRGL
ncbi:phosphonate metabolism protein/1,5-bisphosphokinase (PRPP-forming) PhnN [Chthonobacter rhizosphaerae]|uniref:phosphonate metabolism protein/1,5-bisphosphokinase (PRPP-forming) PhnN n=1 Tax=Chthonobacter rhizosphaerae TaxID=2735553 RepID=UPI0015EF0ED2|nr:phosphonate metabolism protein/1,5-bisphosphokinase (PRPP-forming) PhnN [Chthonobacter rhizosphaerae]